MSNTVSELTVFLLIANSFIDPHGKKNSSLEKRLKLLLFSSVAIVRIEPPCTGLTNAHEMILN